MGNKSQEQVIWWRETEMLLEFLFPKIKNKEWPSGIYKWWGRWDRVPKFVEWPITGWWGSKALPQ